MNSIVHLMHMIANTPAVDGDTRVRARQLARLLGEDRDVFRKMFDDWGIGKP